MFQIEVVGAIGLGLGFIIWLVRLEAKVNKANEKIIDLEIEKEKMQAKHEKELDTIRQNHRSENRVVWEKIDSLQAMVQNVLTSLGRVEGKLEVNKQI